MEGSDARLMCSADLLHSSVGSSVESGRRSRTQPGESAPVSSLNCVNFIGPQRKTHSAFLTTHTETNQTQMCLCSFTHSLDGPENVLLKPSPLQDHNTGGSNIDLMCSADSRPLALRYRFQNEVPLSGTGPQLKLANVETKRSGNYSCQAFNNKTMRNGVPPPAAIAAALLQLF